MRNRWDINRALIVIGALLIIGSVGYFMLIDPAHAVQSTPLVAGAVLALAIAFFAPPWMYLVAGILASLFPLVVIFVFGAIGAIEHPGGGGESSAMTLILMGAILALLGGIMGVAQARKGTAPRAGAGLGAPQGAFAGLLVALLLGMVLSNVLASKDARAELEAPISHIEGADETRTLVAAANAFAPSPLRIPVGKLVDVKLTNEDPVFHTLSYRLDGKVHTTLVPVGSEQDVWLKFDAPQTIHFWCDPHSTETDTTPGGMYGDLIVE